MCECDSTSDWFQTVVTLLCKQISIAVGTVRPVILWCKLLPSQSLVAVTARKAVAMPRCVLVRDSAFCYRLKTTKNANNYGWPKSNMRDSVAWCLKRPYKESPYKSMVVDEPSTHGACYLPCFQSSYQQNLQIHKRNSLRPLQTDRLIT